jgi:N-succinyldiaminopimelate aminotransferase
MPRFPGFAKRTESITGSVFEKFRAKFEAQAGNIVGLHIGDSYAPPPYDLPIDVSFIDAHPDFNRYCDTFGVAELREALVGKLLSENNLEVTPQHVMMTSGTCSALNISMQGLVDPGEEVVLLAPYWPFFRGMVRLAGGTPVELPFYDLLYENPDLDVEAHIEKHVNAKTIAIYVNTPNNPSGKVLSREQLEQVAAVARRHKLWLISDEAYDGMTYDGREHHTVASFDGMFEQTLSMFTFSKVYMFSGLRLGYVVAKNDVLKNLNKIMVHQYYSPPTVAQYMMVEPVRTHAEWSGRFVKHFQDLRDMFVRNLKISPQVPEGTYYFFFPVDRYLPGRKVWDVINACVDAGVAVAPGEDFGAGYANYIRLCFTGETPERLELAVERLNQIFPG